MPRVSIPRERLRGPADYEGLAFVESPADQGDGNACLLTGGEIVLARNSSSSVSRVVTITSASDGLLRTRDIVVTLQPEESRMFGPFTVQGWRQTDGYLYMSASSADVLFSAFSTS